MDYGITFNGTVFTPNGTAVAAADNTDRNLAIERAELAAWAGSPDRAVAYFSFDWDSIAPSVFVHGSHSGRADGIVTTWTGTRIGAIVAARVYRHNFGGRMVAVTVKGTNGATYYGRASWDNGNVVKLRRKGA